MFEDPGNAVPGLTHRKVLQIRGGAGAFHATFVAGIAAGDDFGTPGTGANRGNAWAARLVSGLNSEVMFAALTANRAQGATIHTNSWHTDEQGPGNPAPYNQTAVDVDTFTFANQDHLVLGSMGNNGEEQGAPETAKNAIGINASFRDPAENAVGDGNPGPTLDGRLESRRAAPGVARRQREERTEALVGNAGGDLARRVLGPAPRGRVEPPPEESVQQLRRRHDQGAGHSPLVAGIPSSSASAR